jgi:hypothetical protein
LLGGGAVTLVDGQPFTNELTNIAAVQQWVAQGTMPAGIMLYAAIGANSALHSSEATAAAWRPMLVIEAEPLSGTIVTIR